MGFCPSDPTRIFLEVIKLYSDAGLTPEKWRDQVLATRLPYICSGPHMVQVPGG